MNEKNTKLVGLLQTAVRTKSYSGEEGRMADLMEKMLLEFGFENVQRLRYGTVVGCVRGSRPGPVVLFDGHMDTVEVVDQSEWSVDPWGGEIRENKLYGRGSADMKGGLIAMVCAVRDFTEGCGRDFAGEVWVSCSVHEECFEGISCREITKVVKPDLVISPEPTNMVSLIAQLGRAEIVVETEGVAAHSSLPEAGVNAVYHMAELIREIRTIEPKYDHAGRRGILELTDIISSPYPGASVVPSLCRVTYDRRTLIGESPADVLKPIEDAIGRVKARIPELKARVYFAEGKAPCYTGEMIAAERFFPAWEVPEDNALVQKFVAGMKDAGLAGETGYAGFCTNCSHFGGDLGIPCIICGPAPREMGHARDEYILIDSVCQVRDGYVAALRRLMVGER